MRNSKTKRIDVVEEQKRKLDKAKVLADQGKLAAPARTSLGELIQMGVDITAQFKNWVMQPYEAQAKSLEVDKRNELQKIVDDIVDEHPDIDQNGLWYEIKRLKDKYSDVITSVSDERKERINKYGALEADKMIIWIGHKGGEQTSSHALKDYLWRSKKRRRQP